MTHASAADVDGALMIRTLFVNNLSPTTSPRDLRDLFSQAGQVAAITLARDGITGRERRAAYVEMQSHDGAEAAVARFHLYRLQGRTLNVSASRPESNASGRSSPAPLEAVPPRRRERDAGDNTPAGVNTMVGDGGSGAVRNAS